MPCRHMPVRRRRGRLTGTSHGHVFPRQLWSRFISSVELCKVALWGGRDEELVNGTELENYLHGYLVCDYESGYQLTPGQLSPGNNDAQRL